MGTLYLILAYILYGTSNAVGGLAFAEGSNPYQLAFLNACLALPLILLAMRVLHLRIRIGARAMLLSLAVGLWMAALTLSLNLSYLTIGVGMGTMLHMCHTVVAAFGEAAIVKRLPRVWTLLAIVSVLAGIYIMAGGGGTPASAMGVALALFSGLAYGSIMLMFGHTSLAKVSPFQVQLYGLLIAAVILGVVARANGSLDLAALTPRLWGMHLFCALSINVCAFVLIQWGIRRTGAATGAITGALEPVTSAVLGVLLLSETMTAAKLLGCALIILGISLEPLRFLWQKHRAPQRGLCPDGQDGC